MRIYSIILIILGALASFQKGDCAGVGNGLIAEFSANKGIPRSKTGTYLNLFVCDLSTAVHSDFIAREFTIEVRGSYRDPEKLREALMHVQSSSSLKFTEAFLQKAINLFSEKFVTGATFVQPTDKSDIQVREISGDPEKAEAKLSDPSLNRLFMVCIPKNKGLPDASYELFLKRKKRTPFSVTVPVLKNALGHICGIDFPEWRAVHLARRLGRSHTENKMWVKFYSNEAVHPPDRQFLELTLFGRRTVKEKFDADVGVTLELVTGVKDQHWALVTNANEQMVTFGWLPEGSMKGVIELLVIKETNQRVFLPEAKVAEYLFLMMGVHVPFPIVGEIVHMLTANKIKSEFHISFEADVDFKIAQVLGGSLRV